MAWVEKLKTLRSDANPNSKTTLDSALQTVKILHVDDEVNLLTTTKQILELQNQFHVESAASVNEAFQKLRETKFDVILSDYQMPEKNGLMFLTEIRERGSNVPFILFTGKGREEVAIKALNLGADYYINKLGRPETVYPQLSHCILQAVQNRKAEEKLKYKVEFESVLTRISSRFVNPTNFDEALNNSFKDLGEISGASRIWLFMLRENGTIIDGVHEWCAESVAPQIESLRKLSVEQICWGLMQLREGKIIQIPDVSLLPPNATGVKEVLERKNIKSIIVLPIIGSGALAGFIGFNDVHITGAWNSDDVALLQIVSELIGNSLERKKTEEKLKDSEKKYRLLTENTTDVVYIQDVNLNVTYVTPSVETVAGYSPEELMKLTPDKFMTPESFERGVADFKEAVTLSGKDPDYKIPFKQYEYVKKDGSTFWGELKLRFLHDSEGNLLGTQGTLRDITDRKQTEEKLRESEKEHRLLTENITDVIFILDLNLKTTYVSPSIKNLAGYSPEEIYQLKTKDFMASESFERGATDFAEAISSDAKKPDSEIPLKQYEYIRKDGTRFWGELKTKVLHDSEGCPVGFQGTLRDVTDRKRTEEKLKASEEQYRLLTENITDVVFIQDLDMNITYASPSVEAVTGYTPEEAITVKPKQFLSPKSYEKALDIWKKDISRADNVPKDHIRLLQYEYVRKDGSTFWGELKVKFLRDSKGCLIGTQGILRDITDRKKTEEKLKESEEKYRLLNENASDVVFVQDMDFCITYASPSVEAMMGYTPDEVTKLTFKDFMTPESYERAVKNWNKATALIDKGVETGSVRLMQYEYVRKDGSTFWGEIKAKLLLDLDGQLLGTHGILRDITERKKIEEKLKESEEQYRLLTENTTDVIFIQNLDMSIKYVSPSVEALSGYTPEEVIKLGPHSLMTPESFERGLKEIQADLALAAKNPDHETSFRCYEYIRKDGSTGWGEFKPKLLRDSEGNIIAMQGTLRDVTERKKAEDALLQEQEKLESVTSTLKAGLAIISKDYTILWANKFLTDLCGDVHGKTCYDVFNDHNGVCPNCGVKEIFETGKSHVVCEQSVPVPGGKRAWVELTANPIRDEQGNIIAASELSVVVDERKQMECKLREAEKKYHFLFDKAPLGIFLLDLKGGFVEFNDAAHCQLGYSRKEFEKMCVADIEVVDSPEEIIARIKKIQKTGKDEFETKHRTKNGEIRDVINAISLIEVEGKPFFYVVKRDITEQKKAESALIETLEKMEITNEKLTVVGKLTRHDVRNKLSVIANNVYLARRQMKNNSDISKYLDSVDLAVDQVDRIFSFARTYEMLGIEELSYVNIKSCIDEAISLFSGIDGVTFVNDCSRLLVLADSLLTQLFYNLIDDSLKHGQTVSKIRVCCKEANDHLKLIYEDNGIGIPENEKEIIFKEGYGKDSGYGLYLIRKICEAYAWTITETGKSGSGAQFTVTIPKFNKYNKPTYKIS